MMSLGTEGDTMSVRKAKRDSGGHKIPQEDSKRPKQTQKIPKDTQNVRIMCNDHSKMKILPYNSVPETSNILKI